MNDRLEKAMMAMKLLEMFRAPQQAAMQQQQEEAMRQQVAMQQQQKLQQEAEQYDRTMQFNQERQKSLQEQGILDALVGVARDQMTGTVDPRLVLEYIKSLGVNLPMPQQQMTPEQSFNQLIQQPAQ